MSEPKSYTIATLQDIVDKVPTDKIVQCMAELAVGFVAAKSAVELTFKVAQNLAKKDGRIIPDLPEGTRLIEVPPIEWVDDDKGNVVTELQMPDGSPMFTIKDHVEAQKKS